MKKRILILSTLIFTAVSLCFANIAAPRFKIAESEEEFDVNYYVTENMKILEPVQNEDLDVTQAFMISKNGISAELRYSLFTDTGGSEESFNQQYVALVFTTLSNIYGKPFPLGNIKNFNPEDVKKEFNGDFGCTVTFSDFDSDYGKGYKYMNVCFFYKKNQGLVMRAFLTNDLAFFGINEDGTYFSDNLMAIYFHSFKFMEKPYGTVETQ